MFLTAIKELVAGDNAQQWEAVRRGPESHWRSDFVFFILNTIHLGKLYYPIDSAIDIAPFSRHRIVLLWFSHDFTRQTKSP
jgi:hypothetical protein